jgi:hypothetical protein
MGCKSSYDGFMLFFVHGRSNNAVGPGIKIGGSGSMPCAETEAQHCNVSMSYIMSLVRNYMDIDPFKAPLDHAASDVLRGFNHHHLTVGARRLKFLCRRETPANNGCQCPLAQCGTNSRNSRPNDDPKHVIHGNGGASNVSRRAKCS